MVFKTSGKKNDINDIEKKRRAIVYSTEKIESIKNDINSGYVPDMNPFFCGDPKFKDADIIFRLTEPEKEEWRKCFSDCGYFIKNYVPFENDNGVTLVKLRDYQEKFIHLLADEYFDEKISEFIPKYRYLISMQSRQMGKTTTVAAYFIWYMIFHNNRHLAVVANKLETVKEIIRKIETMISNLPFFLKPGIKNKNQRSIYLDNGTFIQGFATSTTPSIGFTIHVLYIDEAALISPNIMDSFWQAVFPTLSSSKLSKLIMTSTPRGKRNKFYDIWSKAVRHENSFKAYRVDYWQNPMYDEKWAEKTRKDFGDEEFAQDFELKFDIETDKLIRSKDLQFFSYISRIYKTVDIPIMPREISDCFYWNNTLFNPLDYKNVKYRYLLSIDTAEGKEQQTGGKKDSDYNIINIFRIELMNPNIMNKFSIDKNFTINDCFRYRQVGIFIDNERDEEFMTTALKYLVYRLLRCGETYVDSNKQQKMIDNCRVLLEMNFNGKNVLNLFKNDDHWYESIIINTYHRKPIPGEFHKKQPGFITAGGSTDGNRSKSHFCQETSKMITRREIICDQNADDDNKSTIRQLSDFGKVINRNNSNYTYKGIELHDDIAMTVMNLSRVCDIDQIEYEDWLTEYLEILPDSPRKDKICIFLKSPDKKHSQNENTALSDNEFKNIYSNMSGYNPYLNMQKSNMFNNNVYNNQKAMLNRRLLNSYLNKNK